MFLPKHAPLYSDNTSKAMKANFSLLSWNIQKLNQSKEFSPMINHFIDNHQLDFILLQEVKLNIHKPIASAIPLPLSNYTYLTSPNIQTHKHIYGVLTASHHQFLSHQKILSHSKEALITTRKSTLITEHPMLDESILLLANLHAINFVPLQSFKRQMVQLYEVLKMHDGAMIVCGDFNTWHQQRFKILNELCQSLNLLSADFDNRHHIKHFMSHPLDHVFYRNLKLEKSEAVDTGSFSDHNPLLITFQCE